MLFNYPLLHATCNKVSSELFFELILIILLYSNYLKIYNSFIYIDKNAIS